MTSTRPVSAAIALALFAQPTFRAQEYPVKPVRLVVPFPPGGGTDIVARLITQKLPERLGANFLIDNRSGAGGSIGAEIVAKGRRGIGRENRLGQVPV
jgi:tripartite-type tricarboxylate transporter receptor subunit TctC